MKQLSQNIQYHVSYTALTALSLSLVVTVYISLDNIILSCLLYTSIPDQHFIPVCLGKMADLHSGSAKSCGTAANIDLAAC